MSTQIRKGNKILNIPDDAVERYVKMGYSVLDGAGNIAIKAIPVDVSQLKMEYTRLSQDVKRLTDEIKTLKDTNAYLTQENNKLTKELATLKSTPISEKPTTTRKRKQATAADDEVKE